MVGEDKPRPYKNGRVHLMVGGYEIRPYTMCDSTKNVGAGFTPARTTYEILWGNVGATVYPRPHKFRMHETISGTKKNSTAACGL